jgi:hypothetical protein
MILKDINYHNIECDLQYKPYLKNSSTYNKSVNIFVCNVKNVKTRIDVRFDDYGQTTIST